MSINSIHINKTFTSKIIISNIIKIITKWNKLNKLPHNPSPAQVIPAQNNLNQILRRLVILRNRFLVQLTPVGQHLLSIQRILPRHPLVLEINLKVLTAGAVKCKLPRSRRSTILELCLKFNNHTPGKNKLTVIQNGVVE